MMFKALFLVCALIGVIKALPKASEPMLTSHFDYLDKLLEKVVRFVYKVSSMEESLKLFTDSIENKVTGFDETLKAYRDSIESKVTGFTDTLKAYTDRNEAFITRHDAELSNIEKTSMDNLKASNQTLTELKETVNTEIQGMIEHSYKEFDEIKKGQMGHKDVVFQVKDVASKPTAESMIKFTTVISNTDNVYNLDTGYFTAPDNGTYWFAAQICTYGNHEISPSIWVNDQLINRRRIWDKDSGICGTVTALSILHANDKVCLKAGPHMNYNPVWENGDYTMNTFMGARMN